MIREQNESNRVVESSPFNAPLRIIERIEFHHSRFRFWKNASRFAGNLANKAKRNAKAMAHFEKAQKLAQKL